MKIETISKITLDLYTKNIVSISAKQYDNKTRFVEITCVENGIIFQVDKLTMSAFIRFKKPDDNGVFNEVEVTSDGKLKIELTEQMLSASGRAIADVFLLRKVFTSEEKPTNIDDIYKVNAPIISIMDFYINITPTALNHSQIESSYEFNALTNALAQIDYNNKKVVELDKTLTGNENIRNNNESARQNNEQTRINSENQRINAENIRNTSEDKRTKSENERIKQENIRNTSEQQRISSENNRIINENDRKTNENIRKSNESQRQTNETNRISSEDKRLSSETDRQSNETTRQKNESTRQTSENTRISNETDRANAEAERVKNEITRISNENTRNTQETKRQADTATAITNANNAAKNANDKANDLQNKLDNNYFVLTNELENSVSSTSTTHAPTANAVKTAYDKAVSVENTINSNKNNWNDKYTKNEIDNKFSTLENNIDWKESVNTFADIAKTYPKPEDGWTVNVKDTDYTYRYSGSAWVAISANAIPKATQTLDGLMSKEDKTSLDGLKNNVVTGIKGNSETTYRKGNVNLTPQNIGALPSTGGILTGETRVTNPSYTNGYVRAWVDNEGGNFEIQSPSGKTYQIDSYNNDYLRIYSTSNDGTYKFAYFNRNTGALSCDGGFNGNAMTASKLQTFRQNSTTETYGSEYPLYAQWRDGTHLRLKCGSYTVETDYATTAGNSTTVNGHTVNSDVPANAKFTDTNTWRPVETSLSNQNLNDIKTPGFYSAGGSNSVSNKPSGVDNFGMLVVHYANGTYYVQKLWNSDGSKQYTRKCNNGTWSSWTEDKLTDTNTWRGIQNNLTSDSTSDSLSAAQGKALKGLIDAKTSSTGTLTGIKMNGVSKGTSGVVDLGTVLTADNYTNYAATKSHSHSYNDLTNKPSIPSVGNGVVTITQNGVSKGAFHMNQSGATNIDLSDSYIEYPMYSKIIDGNYATKFRTETKGDTSHGGYISTIRNNTANVANSPQFGSGIAFGLDDTHGYLYLNYSSAEAYLGGGNQDKLNWIKRIAFTDSTVANATKVNNHTVNADVPSGAKFTDTNTWRPLGTTADTACAGNDSRLSNARPANGGTSTYANYVYATSHQGSWYQNSQWDGTYFQTNYKNGNNVLPMKVGYSGHADSAGSVAWSNVSGRPSSMPASDVYAWAKASTKPSYTKSEVGLGNVDNTADANKSVKYATSAGSASSASKATGVVDYGATNKTIQIGYGGTGISGNDIKYIAGYTTGNGSDVDAKIKSVSKDALKSWLGLDSLITTGYNDTMWSTASGNMYYYIKFSTGIMIMVTIVPDGWGSNEPVYTYPVSFINDRYALIAVDNTSSSSGQTFDRRIPYLWYTKSSFQIYTDSPVSDFYNEGMNDSMSVICIGRWK